MEQWYTYIYDSKRTWNNDTLHNIEFPTIFPSWCSHINKTTNVITPYAILVTYKVVHFLIFENRISSWALADPNSPSMLNYSYK